jgi:hypothetical protein
MAQGMVAELVGQAETPAHQVIGAVNQDEWFASSNHVRTGNAVVPELRDDYGDSGHRFDQFE